MQDEGLTRRDLTALEFVTIDSASTEDMDDALYAEESADGKLHLTVAIADPTAWIAEGSKLTLRGEVLGVQLPAGLQHSDAAARRVRRSCSLRPNEVRPVLACRMTIPADGAIEDDIEFFAATIESKAKLAYDNVSDWLENTGSWKPE